MLPDQVPPDQRGEASGYYGAMNMIGTIFGFIVVGAFLIPTGHLRIAILTLPLVVAVAGALVFFGVPDRRTNRRSSQPILRSVVLSFAIDARKYRDFAWLMVSRLFFLMAPVGISTYALNFIRFTFHYSEGKAVAIFERPAGPRRRLRRRHVVDRRLLRRALRQETAGRGSVFDRRGRFNAIDL